MSLTWYHVRRQQINSRPLLRLTTIKPFLCTLHRLPGHRGQRVKVILKELHPSARNTYSELINGVGGEANSMSYLHFTYITRHFREEGHSLEESDSHTVHRLWLRPALT